RPDTCRTLRRGQHARQRSASATRRSPGFDYLSESELQAPQGRATQAQQILREHYGIEACTDSQARTQAKDVLVRAADGTIAGVLKIANPAFNATELAAQDAAAEAIAAAEPSLRVATALPNLSGETRTEVSGLSDGTAHVRLPRYLPGGTLVK